MSLFQVNTSFTNYLLVKVKNIPDSWLDISVRIQIISIPINSVCSLLWAPCHEGALGNRDIAPRILELGTRWRWVVSFKRRPLYPQEKSRRHPLDRSLGGPQSRSGSGCTEKNSQPLPEIEPPIIQPVAQCYTTKLAPLLEPCILQLTI
jgi:hypothetical protein